MNEMKLNLDSAKDLLNMSPRSQNEAACWALGGAFLAWHGLRRTRLLGLAAAVVGGTLVYRGLSTFCEQGESCSLMHHPERPEPRVEKSRVDEASWESFPASDPPSYSQPTV